MRKSCNLVLVFLTLITLALAGCGGSNGSGVGNSGTITPGSGGSSGGSGGTTTDPVDTKVGSITLTGYFNNQLVALGANPNDDSKSYGLIRGVVKDTSGQPLPGQTLTFTTTSGDFSPGPSVVTDEFGTAQIYLVAPPSLGSGTVSASAGGVTSNEIQATFVNGPADSIILGASPNALGPGGKSALTAYVRDALGFPVPGEYCTFTISDRQSGDSANIDPVTVQTDGTGKATANYTAGNTSGTDVIEAKVGNATGAQNIIVSQAATFLSSLTLQVANSSLVADGTDSTVLTATVKDNSGKPQAGVEVTFSTTLGSLREFGTQNTPAATVKVTSDDTGLARASLIAGNATGEAEVKATAGGLAQTQIVSLVPGPPASIALTAFPTEVAPTGTSTITATVKDKDNHAVVGKDVAFELTATGSGNPSLSAVQATTNAVGQAKVTYTAGIQPGTDTIKARALTNNLESAGLTFNVSSETTTGVVGSVALSSGAASIIADAVSSTAIRAVVTDTNGKPIPGFIVNFTTTAGTLSPSSATTDATGVAEVKLTSAQGLGNALIIGTCNGFSDTTSVTFVPGQVNSVALNATPSSVGAGGQTNITASVSDASGNPVPGETVQFYFAAATDNVSNGTLSNAVGTTDNNGRFGIVYTAGTNSGTDTISAKTTNGTSGSVDLTVGSAVSNIASLDLSAASSTIVANGTSSSLLQATVMGTDGLPKPGVPVDFTTTQGHFKDVNGLDVNTSTATTDANGVASMELFSETSPAVALVTAATGGFSKEAQVSFVSGGADAANSSITASPATLPANGTAETTVTVLLLDANRNLVANGTPVTLMTTAGTITSANPAPTSSGRATFTLQAPTAQETATLSVAEVAGLSGSVSFGTASTGIPADIQLSVADSQISVAGVGQKETTTVNIEILESNGVPIDETKFTGNTARISFLTQPNGGEYLSGKNAAGNIVSTLSTGTIDVVTTGGSASINLQSGIRPGPVEIRVEALGADGNPLNPPVVASLPQVNIASGPPHTIELSHPITHSVIDLNTANPSVPGFYRRVGSASVTDRYGNDVPDGTVINLGLVDSVINMGSTGASTAGDPVLTDPGGAFLNDFITRNNAPRYIQDNDRVLIFNAQAEDKSRFVTNASSRTQTTLVTSSNLQNNASSLDYVVGASLLGAYISGDDGSGNLIKGTAVVQNGTAKFWVTYPANSDTILNGCYGYSGADPGSYFGGDVRFDNPKSSQVYVVASTSSNDAATVDRGQFCFAAIAGFSLGASPAKLSGSGTVTLDLADGGDGISLPFVPVSYSITYDTLGTYDACSDPVFPDKTTCEAAASCSDGTSTDLVTCYQNGGTWAPTWQTGIPSDLNISVDMTYSGGIAGNEGRTDINGSFVAPVTVTGGLSGDKATITFGSGDGEATVSVSIP